VATQLKGELASLSLAPPMGKPSSPTAGGISGKSFQVESNAAGVHAVRFDFRHNACTFLLTDASGEYPIRCGLEKWSEGLTNMPGTPPKLTVGDLRPLKIAASGTWKDAKTFVMTWRYYETPHHDTVTAHFDGDNVKVEFLGSIAEHSSRPEPRPPLIGHAV
jgi:hypothetical protein